MLHHTLCHCLGAEGALLDWRLLKGNLACFVFILTVFNLGVGEGIVTTRLQR